ncbi:MAG: Fic family protein [Bacteroidales bacterium]|nr:Fic family protein [Bacteroidales bacterium]MCM1414462.1 Fic family protein [bacterium]MCM1422341.1 Fic family protein [bacterium]
MEFMNVNHAAEKWNVSERSVRNYCSEGKIPGAILVGKTWKIPMDAQKPARKQRSGKSKQNLLARLKLEKESGIPGGIYHKIQIDLTYNSNHMEGSRLTHDQTRYIFETNTIGIQDAAVNVDDIVETSNHFRCIDHVIDYANYPLSESFIKQLHVILKTGTSDSRKAWFNVGSYKRFENEVGGKVTTKPADVSKEMKNLLKTYHQHKTKRTLQEIIAFHYTFEKIHPFQDGNGRIGRLIMFKECLRNDVTPFIIEDTLKEFYYRGLKEWEREPGYLIDTCLTAQDRFKASMDYFNLEYTD